MGDETMEFALVQDGVWRAFAGPTQFLDLFGLRGACKEVAWFTQTISPGGTVMVDGSNLIVYLLASVVVVLMPGPGMLFVISRGISNGSRAGLVATLGTTGGIIVHVTGAALGLSMILHTSAVAFQVVKFAGVGYLIYLAWKVLKSKEELLPDIRGGITSRGSILWQGFLVNALNPKLSLFFLAFLPQFVDVELGSVPAQTMVLGVIFMVLTGVIFAGYGLFAGVLRRRILSSPRISKVIRWVFASIFVALGVRLALAEHQ